jgi:hypothetical protein
MKVNINKPCNWLLPDVVPVCAIGSNFCLTVEDGCEIDEMFYVSVSGNICVDYSGEIGVAASSMEGIL